MKLRKILPYISKKVFLRDKPGTVILPTDAAVVFYITLANGKPELNCFDMRCAWLV